MINRERTPHTLSKNNLAQADSQFLKNIVVSGAIVVGAYIGLNLYFQAYLSAIVSCITLFLLIPIVLYLQKKELYIYSKIALVFTGSFSIIMSSYGHKAQGQTEYYFLPIMMLSLILFEPRQKKLVAFSLFLPTLTWLFLKFAPNPFANSALLPSDDFPYNYFSIFNFIGASCLTYMFLNHYSRAITKSKQIEIENEHKLLTASKMTSLGELANGIAHEVNNPLSVIIGRTQLLKSKVENMNVGENETAACMQSLNKIQDTAELITKIIKGLSAFSRDSDNDPMTSHSIKRIVQYAVELCEDRIKATGIKIRLEHKTNLRITCRDVQIVQVLVNLINNAIDAIEKLPDKWIEITSYSDSRHIFIAVVDSGSGIPAALTEKIMQPFFSTKETGKGIGLGLSISKGIIETHGGQLSYDSTSANTRFVVELPVK